MCGVCCGLCALSTIDTSELDASERGSDDPASRMMKQDSYTPPTMAEDVENNIQETKTSAEYGTFYHSSTTSPMIVEENQPTSPSVSSPPVVKATTTTTITEVDID